MSVLSIKSKLFSRNSKTYADLEATNHTNRMAPSMSHHQILTQSERTNWSDSDTYSEIHQIHQSNKAQNFRISPNIRSINSQVQPYRKVPYQFSTDNIHTNWKSLSIQAIQNNIGVFNADNNSEPTTPKSKLANYCLMAKFRNKVIKQLSQVETVESKCLMSQTPRQVLQQSEVVFKGSRDVQKIAPIRLVYQQQQTQEQKQRHQKKSNKNICGKFGQLKLIKKSNTQTALFTFKNGNNVFSLIKTYDSFCLQHLASDAIMEIYYKRKIHSYTYFFCQPYQYTLNQLIKAKKIKTEHLNIVCQYLEISLQILCKERYTFFQVNGIQNQIFYIHGKFKILPLFPKGKIKAVKGKQILMREIQTYLRSLL